MRTSQSQTFSVIRESVAPIRAKMLTTSSMLLKVAVMTLAICNYFATGIISKRLHGKRQKPANQGLSDTQGSDTQA